MVVPSAPKNNFARVATCGRVAKHCIADQKKMTVNFVNTDCNVICEQRDALTREIHEAYVIARLQDMCISAASVALAQKEIKYLDCKI